MNLADLDVPRIDRTAKPMGSAFVALWFILFFCVLIVLETFLDFLRFAGFDFRIPATARWLGIGALLGAGQWAIFYHFNRDPRHPIWWALAGAVAWPLAFSLPRMAAHAWIIPNPGDYNTDFISGSLKSGFLERDDVGRFWGTLALLGAIGGASLGAVTSLPLDGIAPRVAWIVSHAAAWSVGGICGYIWVGACLLTLEDGPNVDLAILSTASMVGSMLAPIGIGMLDSFQRWIGRLREEQGRDTPSIPAAHS